jgi:hypothetical protein
MATRFNEFIKEFEQDGKNVSVEIRSIPVNKPRTLRTLLTDEQLANHGLSVLALQGDFSTWASKGELALSEKAQARIHQWLVDAPANDQHSPPVWLEALEARVNALRGIAEEEDLPLSEESIAAGLSFVRSLRRTRRPSAFLVGNGNLRLVWLTEQNEQVGLQFRGSKDVQFVLLKLRDGHLGHTMGSDTATGVLVTIAAMGLTHVLDG